jgi:hypothetical protein
MFFSLWPCIARLMLPMAPYQRSKTLRMRHPRASRCLRIPPTPLGRLGLLPAEIRNIIYELHLLPNDRKPFVARWVVSPPNHMLRPYKTRIPSILAVSSIIRRETMPIYYRSHELRFMVNCDELLCVLDRLNLLVMNLDSADLIVLI